MHGGLSERHLFRVRRGKVGIEWVDVHSSLLRQDNEIHVIHRNGAKNDLIPHDNGASKRPNGARAEISV